MWCLLFPVCLQPASRPEGCGHACVSASTCMACSCVCLHGVGCVCARVCVCVCVCACVLLCWDLPAAALCLDVPPCLLSLVSSLWCELPRVASPALFLVCPRSLGGLPCGLGDRLADASWWPWPCWPGLPRGSEHPSLWALPECPLGRGPVGLRGCLVPLSASTRSAVWSVLCPLFSWVWASLLRRD